MADDGIGLAEVLLGLDGFRVLEVVETAARWTVPGPLIAVIGLVVNQRLIDEQPHLVKALVTGYIDGIRGWRNSPSSAKAYLKKSYQTSDAEVDTVYAEINRFLLLEPAPNLDSIRNTWDSMADLKGRKDIDLSKFVESRFVDEALRALR